MRRILALSAFVAFILMLSSATANAGKNAGGALIVHTDDNVSYTHTGQYCGAQFSDPGTCESAVTRTDKDENTPAMIWLLAAFPDTANPGVSVVYFGIEHNLGEGSFVNHGYCGPAGSLEIPDAGWPDTGFGNSLAFGSPVQGDVLFPIYWFAVSGVQGSYLATSANPTAGYAAVVDDGNPPLQEPLDRFGMARWGAPGENTCPASEVVGDLAEGEDQGSPDDPEDPCDYPPEPQRKIIYKVLALDVLTSTPVSGLRILAQQELYDANCYTGDCGDCEPPAHHHLPFQVTTGADGTATEEREDESCCLCGPYPTRCYRHHVAWDPPSIPEQPYPGEYSEWVLTRWTPGSGDISQVVWVTHESALAQKFAPVLHKHPGLELQEDLADAKLTLEDLNTRICGAGGGGNCFYGWTDIPPLEAFSGSCSNSTCSYAHQENEGVYWTLDIDDGARHLGAAPGQRPVYYHVFPKGEDMIVQYWFWYNCNDIREQVHPDVFHEGDWESVAVRLSNVDGEWGASAVNLYRHDGGHTFEPDECWWSQTAVNSYFGMDQGYSDDRTHLHVWIAANAHGAYNRNEPVYTVTAGGSVRYWDRVDYGIANNGAGGHRYFAYDRLVPTGEFLNRSDVHGCYWWQGHWTGPFGGTDETAFLKYTGWFGVKKCPDGLPSWICEAFGLYMGTKSPLEPEDPHEWRNFTVDYDGWGAWSYQPNPPEGNYLGWFRMRMDGDWDRLQFSVPAYGDGLANVWFTVVSGDAEFANADALGKFTSRYPVDGFYLFDETEASGDGVVSIWMTEAGSGRLLAGDCRAEIRPRFAAGLEEAPTGKRRDELRILSATGARPVVIGYGYCSGSSVLCEIVDVGGRVIERVKGVCSGGSGGEIVWKANHIGHGVFFARVWNGREWLRAKPIVLP